MAEFLKQNLSNFYSGMFVLKLIEMQEEAKSKECFFNYVKLF